MNKNKLQELDSIIADYENRIKELMGTYDNLSESINTTIQLLVILMILLKSY